MTDEISKARQALRDYAREEIVERRTLTGNFDHVPYKFVVGTRGTTAGKAFVAVQDVLTLLEKDRVAHKRWEGHPASDTALIFIDNVEAAILKALS
jgi:hypothetical protein